MSPLRGSLGPPRELEDSSSSGGVHNGSDEGELQLAPGPLPPVPADVAHPLPVACYPLAEALSLSALTCHQPDLFEPVSGPLLRVS